MAVVRGAGDKFDKSTSQTATNSWELYGLIATVGLLALPPAVAVAWEKLVRLIGVAGVPLIVATTAAGIVASRVRDSSPSSSNRGLRDLPGLSGPGIRASPTGVPLELDVRRSRTHSHVSHSR